MREFTPIAVGAQQASATLMWAFQDRVLTDMTGVVRAPAPLDIDTVTGRALRGVAPEDVYARPFAEIWRMLAEHEAMRGELLEEARQSGEPVDEVEARLAEERPLTKAVAAGERRARLLGITDLELAEREAVRQVLVTDPRTSEIEYYRRVLTGDENCGLCVVASTQRYRKAELLPIHPGCDCVSEPLPPGQADGQVVDEQLLDAAHDAIKARFGISDRSGREIDYRKILLVREHGELGPVLTVAKHRFTDVDGLDIPAPRRGRSTPAPSADDDRGAAASDTASDVGEPESPRTIAELAAQEPADTRRLGGSTAYTDLVEYADGSRLIHKVNGSRATSAGYDAVEITDAEVLGARVLEALRLRAPQIHRESPTDLWMEYVDGRLGGEVYGFSGDLPADVADSPEARRLGLADYYMIQTDRNPGNVIVTDAGETVGIDNVGWLEGTNVDWPSHSPYARWLYRATDSGSVLADQIAVSPDDLAEAGRRLEALRTEFESAGRLTWWQLMMARHELLVGRSSVSADRLW